MEVTLSRRWYKVLGVESRALQRYSNRALYGFVSCVVLCVFLAYDETLINFTC